MLFVRRIPLPRSSPLLLLIFFCCFDYSSAARSVGTPERIVTKIAENVYAIQHKDVAGLFVQGNTTVIIGDQGVLVIDAPMPSLCREDIADIKRWTPLPVKYLVNTHWHPDHQRGNPAYVEAFPGITIIAQTETARLMKSFDTENLSRFMAKYRSLEQKLASNQDDDGNRLSDSARQALKKLFDGQTLLMQDYKNYSLQFPGLLFESELRIDLGNREVILKAVKGHTAGDAIAWLPQEKILVAGDQVAWPVPYFFAGNPYEALAGLEELINMGAKIIVPGHGKVQVDTLYMNRVIQLIRTISEQVNSVVFKKGSISTTLEDVQKQIDYSTFQREFAGEDKDSIEFFNESMEGLVKGLYYHLVK